MQQFLQEISSNGILGNSPQRLLLALLTFLALSLVFLSIVPFFLRVMQSYAAKRESRLYGTILQFLSKIPYIVWGLLSCTLALKWLILPATAQVVLSAFSLIIIVIIGVLILQRVLEYAFLRYTHAPEGYDHAFPSAIRDFFGLLLWLLGALLVLSNIGINVTSLIAGLGIGGLAVALAMQRILGDIFSSFSIYLDKPFREGDYIVTGDHSGFVKKIGLKTTRIQALEGEEVVIPNQELTQSRIRNYKRMQQRHIEFDVTVMSDTPSDKLRKIPQIARTIIDKLGLLRFERTTLTKFAKSGITFTIVYDVRNSDYDSYINLQQEINLQLIEELRKEGIGLA